MFPIKAFTLPVIASLASAQISTFPPFTGDMFIKYTISAPSINATFIPYGARLTNLWVNDKNGNPQDVVLGYDTGQQYLNDTETVHTYFGAVVGRYANRIRDGKFTLDGVTYNIPKNEHNGLDTLHGGFIGYDQRNWTLICQTIDSITFALYDQAYEGFPGDVINYATYTVSVENDVPRWTSRLVSIPLDAATPIMLTNHVYWNLGAFINTAGSTILDDTLYMPYSDRYIETDGIEVPTGVIGYVKNTPLDFTTPKPIGADINQTVNNCGTGCTGYDNAFILDRPSICGTSAENLTVLTMISPETGIKLDVKTNQNNVQIYSCNNLDGMIVAKSDQQHGGGRTTYGKYACVALEPQQWIDGINHPEWGQEEWQIYRTTTGPAVHLSSYEFSVVQD
jgi:aldose 1-epimerase